jgi:hypothetical protein
LQQISNVERLRRPPMPDRKINVATEKQIAANRANSKRSTGPKTKTGRLTSSRNAFRHGLSSQSPANQANIEAIAQALVLEGQNPDVAAKIAPTELELLRVRCAREQMMTLLFQGCNPHQISHLAALDRYERRALAKRRRASARLTFFKQR